MTEYVPPTYTHSSPRSPPQPRYPQHTSETHTGATSRSGPVRGASNTYQALAIKTSGWSGVQVGAPQCLCFYPLWLPLCSLLPACCQSILLQPTGSAQARISKYSSINMGPCALTTERSSLPKYPHSPSSILGRGPLELRAACTH